MRLSVICLYLQNINCTERLRACVLVDREFMANRVMTTSPRTQPLSLPASDASNFHPTVSLWLRLGMFVVNPLNRYTTPRITEMHKFL